MSILLDINIMFTDVNVDFTIPTDPQRSRKIQMVETEISYKIKTIERKIYMNRDGSVQWGCVR